MKEEEERRKIFEKSVIDTFYAQQLAGISHPSLVTFRTTENRNRRFEVPSLLK
jgi:hypothetical protein